MNHIEAMKQALEALESCTPEDTSTGHVIYPSYDEQAVEKAITALRTAIEQAEKQEPVAWVVEDQNGERLEWAGDVPGCAGLPTFPLYTTPPAAPVQEPVAWVYGNESNDPIFSFARWDIADREGWDETPLYTNPPVAPVQEPNIGALGMPVNVPVTPAGSAEAFCSQEIQDLTSLGARLALELECLLLESKDTAAISKWWDTAHEALADWHDHLWQVSHGDNYVSPLGKD